MGRFGSIVGPLVGALFVPLTAQDFVDYFNFGT
jgi:hypothetical protein